MRKAYIILFLAMAICAGCQWHWGHGLHDSGSSPITIERYDRLERHFLTSGDVAALQQMNTEYPAETRTLIEDVLRIGHVDEPDINARFLTFFQDSTLQTLLSDVQRQYADMSDIESLLTAAFGRLANMIPTLQTPRIYTQIGSLDQSIIVGDGILGISLDKYLGADHPVYLRYGYSEQQRQGMKRENIVPDCIAFYLLSLYPTADERHAPQHIAKIQHVVNRAMAAKVFTGSHVSDVEKYMESHPETTTDALLAE